MRIEFINNDTWKDWVKNLFNKDELGKHQPIGEEDDEDNLIADDEVIENDKLKNDEEMLYTLMKISQEILKLFETWE